MKKLTIILLFIAGMASAQNVKIKLDRDDIKMIIVQVKQSMVYDTVDMSDNLASVASCEKVLSKNRNAGMVEVPERFIVNFLGNKWYSVQDYYRAEDEYRQLMRIVYELYLIDPKLKMFKKENEYGLSEARKYFLRDIREAEKGGDKDWMKKKYRKTDLDEDGN